MRSVKAIRKDLLVLMQRLEQRTVLAKLCSISVGYSNNDKSLYDKIRSFLVRTSKTCGGTRMGEGGRSLLFFFKKPSDLEDFKIRVLNKKNKADWKLKISSK